MKLHATFHVSLVKQVKPGSRLPKNPPPLIINGEEEYEVRSILDSLYSGSDVKYPVDWKGFGPHEPSWELACNVYTPHLTC